MFSALTEIWNFETGNSTISNLILQQNYYSSTVIYEVPANYCITSPDRLEPMNSNLGKSKDSSLDTKPNLSQIKPGSTQTPITKPGNPGKSKDSSLNTKPNWNPIKPGSIKTPITELHEKEIYFGKESSTFKPQSTKKVPSKWKGKLYPGRKPRQ